MTLEEPRVLTVLLFFILSKESQRNKYQLKDALKRLGHSNYTTSDINSILYSNKNIFYRSEDTLPLWSTYELEIEEEIRPIGSISDICDLTYYCGHSPREWQKEALEKWIKTGRRSVVEAVTGTGKTTLGILAAADAVARGLDVLIIVPGTDLMDQWYEILINCLPKLATGKFGDGFNDSFLDCNILVATVQSAYRNTFQLDRASGLIIADEVHRYGAEKYSKALKPIFGERLGLTATYDRSDNGLDDFLSPFFSPEGGKGKPGKEVIMGCGYARGLADGILAPFRVVLLGIELDEMEQVTYNSLNEKVIKLKKRLVHNHDCPSEPFGEFIKCVRTLSNGSVGDNVGTLLARQYLDNFTKRRELLASSLKKIEALRHLIPVILSANKTLIYCQTIISAKKASDLLINEGILAREFSSDLKKELRKEILQQFKDGRIRVLAAPVVLDEGIDVPDADMGIILSASHSKRQMIQRMGRIIRPKEDSRSATFIILYAKNTNEDPEYGIHEAFLDEMYDHADKISNKGVDWSVEELMDWLDTHN